MSKKTDFAAIAALAFRREALKKIVFSRPLGGEISKISGRLCAHRGRRILALEYSLPGNTVSQKNVPEDSVEATIAELIGDFKQANLITLKGDVEWKISKSGKEVLLGGDALMRKLTSNAPSFESAIEELDKRKNYILSGKEDFLISLKISDKNGRVHDKMQGKFRQINRFLEHIEDIYHHLPTEGSVLIYDLCCGKSYLSFAVYHYLTSVKKREVELLGIDLKRDVINWCDGLAKELGYSGMTFICDDIKNTNRDRKPDMVISLHACDIATDIVIDTAIEFGAKVILSTPCCHRYMNGKINNSDLKFVTDYPHLSGKLCEAFTDAIRVARLKKNGYATAALELTDPENTPKNTLIRAIKDERISSEALKAAQDEYDAILKFLFKESASDYLTFN